MPRVVSFIVLVAIVLLVASLFFQVMAQFILPLFLAAVLVVVFEPVHVWIQKRTGKRKRLAAALTTLAILLSVLAPLCLISWNGYLEGMDVVGDLKKVSPSELWNKIETRAAKPLAWLESIGITHEKQRAMLDDGIDHLRERIVPLAIGGVQLIFSTLVSLAIMLIAVFYFFADGPHMVVTIMRLSPLDDKYELQLLDQFGKISRTVVLATLLSAVVQGLMAGVGYYFAGVGPVFLLTGLTMLLAMVPFVGAAAVWLPTCAWLYVVGGADGSGAPTAAVVLAIYCGTLVSAADNIVKPYILHGQSNLHPLLALLSVLGGVGALGPIGILVGPMVVAFLQALLNMLQQELETFGSISRRKALQQPAIEGIPSTQDTTENPSESQGKSNRKSEKPSSAADQQKDRQGNQTKKEKPNQPRKGRRKKRKR